jgi:hypothetical protein
MRGIRAATIASAALLAVGFVAAQQPPIDPIPPPAPRKQPPRESAGNYQPLIGESDVAWGLSEELLASLFRKVEIYAAYTRKFTCDEVARLADYDAEGSVSSEKVRRYAYILTLDSRNASLSELRQQIAKNGEIKPGEVKDEEPFPPAYAWVFLFSKFHEPYFSYRYMGDRFDGFDWVHEIQFKGSLPFTDGKDIRQWEGTVLIDAVFFTPLEIHAEPNGQEERIASLYRQWAQSFNLLGMRTGKRPLGYRALIQFRHRREELTFPTELRYDTFRAVGLNMIAPAKASTRSYSNYRLFGVEEEQEIGAQPGP